MPACFGAPLDAKSAAHPVLYASDADREAILAKIRDEAWAAAAWKRLLASIDPFVDRTEQAPWWMVSRLAMYWRDGAYYTQCYLKNQNWDRGEGNAPVPTVRLPGMRSANDYVNVPLEDRIPFNQTGDMLARSRKDPAAARVVVPYKESGRLVSANNAEILGLAGKAAFAWWITGDEKYARFAAGIYWAWLLGTWYMQPPLDPDNSSGGPGGYAPGGTLGYYDYEQIRDDLMYYAAPVYDFLFDYLNANPDPRLKAIGKDLPTATGEVFKRFIDIGMVRGRRTGNWNVSGWNMMLRGILTLERDSFYPDGRGREYYLGRYTTTSTEYHDALPDILKHYDPATGLWPEAPGYALGTINTLLDVSIPVLRAGVDTIGENPMMQKAALATLAWLDPRGNIVVFGDTRGGPGSFLVFERLLTYYSLKDAAANAANASIVAAAIQQGIDAAQYDRGKVGWEGLCANVPLGRTSAPPPTAAVAYSAAHRHLLMRNLNSVRSGLMFTLYGGTRGMHLSPNGLALQLYGHGWALAPDASAYESYTSEDVEYYQGAVGCNTIVPGYAAGSITLNALEPAPAPGQFTSDLVISPFVSFADVSAGEKRRVIGMVRTSPTTGFYVDIFRSKLPDNDYIHHNLATALAVSDVAGHPLAMSETDSLSPEPNAAYRYFKNAHKASIDGDLQADWRVDTVTPRVHMAMWMRGQPGREVFRVDAPPTTLLTGVTPDRASVAPNPTPTLIVRQKGRDGWDAPFVAVFEPYLGPWKSITRIFSLSSDPAFIGLAVESRLPGSPARTRVDTIFNATDAEHSHTVADFTFQGLFGVVSGNGSGSPDIYLGTGVRLSTDALTLRSADGQLVKGRLYRTSKGWRYSADREVEITLPGKEPVRRPPAQDAPI